jgi:hypothetical protein
VNSFLVKLGHNSVVLWQSTVKCIRVPALEVDLLRVWWKSICLGFRVWWKVDLFRVWCFRDCSANRDQAAPEGWGELALKVSFGRIQVSEMRECF